MIGLKTNVVTPQKVAALKRVIGDLVRGEELLRVVRTKAIADEILDYLQTITPRGKRSSGWELRTGAVLSGANMHLADSWRVKRRNLGTRLVLTVHSLLESVGGGRGRAKLMSIEYGRREGKFQAKAEFRFKGDYSWVNVPEGGWLKIAAMPPADILGSAENYLKGTLIPEIRGEVERSLARKMAKFA